VRATGFTILAIDDDSNYLMLLEHVWRSTGTNNRIQCVGGGDKAVDYLKGEGEYSDRSRFPYPGLITLDLKMPHGDGFSVLQHLKSRPERQVVPTAILTGSAEPDDVKKAYLLGASCYHVKPNAYGDLGKLLKMILDYWLTCEVPSVDATRK